jgi:hypothetical protein
MRSPRRAIARVMPYPALALAGGGLALVCLLAPACRTLQPETGAAGQIDEPTFALIDRDGDGRVSPAEMAAFKHEEGLAEIDLDNDKRISLAEWRAARPSASPDDALFHRLDKNGDGFLTEEEGVAHILGQAPFLAAFKAMDANGDGHLHWEEYAAGKPETLEVTLFSSGALGSVSGASP